MSCSDSSDDVPFENSDTVEYRKLFGYPDYRIGSDGSVWTKMNRADWKRMSPCPIPAGYLWIALRNEGRKKKRFSVARLVLLAFVGPCPPGCEARHFPDRNKVNNRIDNLSWATHQVNCDDQFIHGTVRIGVNANSAKLNEEQVKQIVNLLRTSTLGVREIASQFGVKKTAIHKIADGQTWIEITGGRVDRRGCG